MDMNIINLQRLNSKTPRDTAKLPAVARIQCATAGEAGLPVQPVEGPYHPVLPVDTLTLAGCQTGENTDRKEEEETMSETFSCKTVPVLEVVSLLLL